MSDELYSCSVECSQAKFEFSAEDVDQMLGSADDYLSLVNHVGSEGVGLWLIVG